MLIMETQGNSMTLEQFLVLPRYQNGRIRDLPAVFLEIPQDFLEMLHGDDWSYYFELQEEVEYMLAEISG